MSNRQILLLLLIFNFTVWAAVIYILYLIWW